MNGSLPEMERERDECKAVFHSGKLHVIGGYSTEMQGRFERSAESFDVLMWRWDRVDLDSLELPCVQEHVCTAMMRQCTCVEVVT